MIFYPTTSQTQQVHSLMQQLPVFLDSPSIPFSLYFVSNSKCSSFLNAPQNPHTHSSISTTFSLIKMSDSHHSSDGTSEYTKKKQSPKFQDDEFSEEEKSLITRMYNLLGDRWSLIAGRIPGRSAEEIERYWKSRCSTNQ